MGSGGLGNAFGCFAMNVAIHEVTEMTLVEGMRPTDPYFRWFSDGFANAITCLLVEKYAGEEAAQEFAAAYDIGKCRHLERELNLRYWMATDSCIHIDPMPVKAEAEFEYARYAYSLVEARAMIDKHGIDCVHRNAEAFRARESRTGADLLDVIRETIGEDIQERLARYQTFSTREEGLAKYDRTFTFTSSLSQKDYETAFVSVMRFMELRGERFSSNHLSNTLFAAVLLAKMGHAEIADGTMQACIKRYSKSTEPKDRLVALEAFVTYALMSERPRVAQQAADELLQRDLGQVRALTVKMLDALQDKNLPRAKAYARRIPQEAQDTAPSYSKLAAEILAIDPNRPPGDKGVDEPK